MATKGNVIERRCQKCGMRIVIARPITGFNSDFEPDEPILCLRCDAEADGKPPPTSSVLPIAHC
jgi:hypothetical protein